MGQKAKNAGKKVSKTCDKKANGMSMHCKGTRLRTKVILYDDFLRAGGKASGGRMAVRGVWYIHGGNQLSQQLPENIDE